MKAWIAIALLAIAGTVQAETYRFALIGDVPYSDRERRELPLMQAAIADQQVSFIAHIGDIKSGSKPCSDALFADRHELFESSRVPFILVPGDNEWSDCDRRSNGAYDPQERLDKLRSLFWHEPLSLGQKKIPLEQQAGDYPEHARFRLGPVLFVTLNIPGNNNFGLTDKAPAEFLARNPVVLGWLKESFALARREKLAGIVLLFQADPAFKRFAQGFPNRAFREFLQVLRSESESFPGQVVAVHGDSHISRIDRPLRDRRGKLLNNFVRVETFGYPVMGWTLGVIDTNAPTLFRFESHLWESRQK